MQTGQNYIKQPNLQVSVWLLVICGCPDSAFEEFMASLWQTHRAYHCFIRVVKLGLLLFMSSTKLWWADFYTLRIFIIWQIISSRSSSNTCTKHVTVYCQAQRLLHHEETARTNYPEVDKVSSARLIISFGCLYLLPLIWLLLSLFPVKWLKTCAHGRCFQIRLRKKGTGCDCRSTSCKKPLFALKKQFGKHNI